MVIRITNKPFYYFLSFQLAVDLILDAAIGVLYPKFGAALNPLTTGFVKLRGGFKKT